MVMGQEAFSFIIKTDRGGESKEDDILWKLNYVLMTKTDEEARPQTP